MFSKFSDRAASWQTAFRLPFCMLRVSKWASENPTSMSVDSVSSGVGLAMERLGQAGIGSHHPTRIWMRSRAGWATRVDFFFPSRVDQTKVNYTLIRRKEGRWVLFLAISHSEDWWCKHRSVHWCKHQCNRENTTSPAAERQEWTHWHPQPKK